MVPFLIDHASWPSVLYHDGNCPRIEDPLILEYHSILNLLNVVSVLIGGRLGHHAADEDATSVLKRVYAFASSISSHSDDPFRALADWSGFCDAVQALSCTWLASPDSHHVGSILDEVSRVMRGRFEELQDRFEHPGEWIVRTPEQVLAMMKQFFHAVERNGDGRYRIVYDVADQHPLNYLVSFDFQTDRGGCYRMPPVVLDCLRDLAANARKYTDPGGWIMIKINGMGHRLVIRVCDSGLGIPESELHRVVEQGYRARNVFSRRTMGGGFGLTKALWVATRHGGSLELRSREGVGTMVTLEIPIPAG
jgi:signal transduction histidine kinase